MTAAALLLALACCMPLTAAAGGLPADPDRVVSVQAIPGWREADGTHVAGLRVRLAPGWMTYWRSAGAAGIAPRMDWSASGNVAAVTPDWPRPTVFSQGGATAIGYDGDFVLPLRVRPRDTGAAAMLTGRLDLAVCADICLPVQLSVSVALPAAGAADAGLQAALDDAPERSGIAADCSLRPTADGAALTATVTLPSLGPGPEAVVFEMPDAGLWITDARVTRRGADLTATSEVMAAGGGRVVPDPATVRITVIGSARAVELDGCAG